MKPLFLILSVYLISSTATFSQDKNAKFDLGIFYTPPGIIGDEWRKPIYYIPYTIHSNELEGSYELGVNFNYHFAKRWFLSTKISDYNAHLWQHSTADVAIFDPEIEWVYSTDFDVRCHVFNFKPIINLIAAEKDLFSFQILAGPIFRIPTFSNYKITHHTTWGNTLTDEKNVDQIPFHTRMGGCTGFSFTYNLHEHISVDLAMNFEFTRSILDKTHLWYNGIELELENHWQKAIYFPVTVNYNF